MGTCVSGHRLRPQYDQSLINIIVDWDEEETDVPQITPRHIRNPHSPKKKLHIKRRAT